MLYTKITTHIKFEPPTKRHLNGFQAQIISPSKTHKPRPAKKNKTNDNLPPKLFTLHCVGRARASSGVSVDSGAR